MPSCVMRFCTNYSGKACKSRGITYHSFPSNKLRRIQWVDIVRLQRNEDYWQPHSSSKICTVHFKEEDKFTSEKGLTLLKKSARPYLQVPQPQSPAHSNSGIGDVDSDLETAFDSARILELESKLRRQRMLYEQSARRLKSFKQKYNRLAQKHESLKKVLKKLQIKRRQCHCKEDTSITTAVGLCTGDI